VRRWLSKARVSVDPFHLVKLGNDMLTAVRRRVSWDRHDRPGRKADPAWAHRLLRLRGYNSLSDSGKAKLDKVPCVEDPTQEIGAAWSIKEALRLTPMLSTVELARHRRRTMSTFLGAQLPEAGRLKKTIDGWWPEIKIPPTLAYFTQHPGPLSRSMPPSSLVMGPRPSVAGPQHCPASWLMRTA